MKKNMGTPDKVIRVTIAVIAAALYLTNTITGTLGIALLVLSVIFMLNSLFSFCPIYAMFGLKTNSDAEESHRASSASNTGKVLGMMVLLAASSCSEDDSVGDGEEGGEDMARFQSELVGETDMELLIDTETDLVWVNDARGCFAAIINPTTECAEFTFAGRDDWRVPTSAELSELLTEIDARNMNLNYINASCALMSSSDQVWVFTENSDMPGATTTNEPGNAGLRCVTTR